MADLLVLSALGYTSALLRDKVRNHLRNLCLHQAAPDRTTRLLVTENSDETEYATK
jgi:hypothetical protein